MDGKTGKKAGRYSADPMFRVPDDPRVLSHVELRAIALQLRKAGWNYTQIAAVLKMPRTKVRLLVHKELRAVGRQMYSDAHDLWVLECDRLDELQRAIYPRAMTGDPRAIEVLCKIHERRARLMGLDAPLKVEQKIDAQLQSMSDEELLLKAAELGLRLTAEPPRALPSYLPGEEPLESLPTPDPTPDIEQRESPPAILLPSLRKPPLDPHPEDPEGPVS